MTSRSRTCTDPIPVFGGKRCDVLGLPVETKECNVHVCPGEEVLKRVVVVLFCFHRKFLLYLIYREIPLINPGLIQSCKGF